jgi:hypothetical protein
MRLLKLISAFTFLLSLSVFPRAAAADTITETIIFSANFVDGPFPVVSGSFTVSFDPDIRYLDDTRDIVTNSTSPPFTVHPIGFNHEVFGDYLVIGGLPFIQSLACGDTDFFAGIQGASSAHPTLPAAAYSLQSQDACFIAVSGTVRVEPATSAIPEPPSFLLLLSSLVVLVGTLGRRSRHVNDCLAHFTKYSCHLRFFSSTTRMASDIQRATHRPLTIFLR